MFVSLTDERILIARTAPLLYYHKMSDNYISMYIQLRLIAAIPFLAANLYIRGFSTLKFLLVIIVLSQMFFMSGLRKLVVMFT